MEEQIAKLTEDCSAEIASAASESELYSVKVRYLGKSGLISELMKGMRNVPPEQRRAMGLLTDWRRRRSTSR